MDNININLFVLEKVLTQVVKEAYSYSKETYLVIEELSVQTEEINKEADLVFDYYIIGRYGIENTWDRHFNFLVSSNWDYNFLAGYFRCLIDHQDGAHEYDE